MGDTEFGKLVQSLRKLRTFYDESGYPKQWSQQKLAQESKLSVRQIARIEQGKVANLKPYLEPLAGVFRLTETERVAFYAEAGYVYSTKRGGDDHEALRHLLQQLPFPASIRTPLWDFIAVNTYHRIIRGMTMEMVQLLDEGKIGPNLLWALFEPRFQPINTTIHDSNWQAEAIWAFRATSFRHLRTKRYRFLINELKRIPDFERAWILSESLPDYGNSASRRRPVSKISHPEFGVMEFLSLRIPQRYFGDIEVAVYVPVATSEEKYQVFRDTVTSNDVTFFKERPLD